MMSRRPARKPAHPAQRLVERAHHQIGAALEPEVLQRPAAALAHDADAVGVVDHQDGVVALRHRDDLRERAHLAVDAEHALGDDHAGVVVLGLLELADQVVDVVVRVEVALGVAQGDPVEDGGVVALVGDHGRRSLPVREDAQHGIEEALDRAHVGHVAGGEGHGVLGADQMGQPPLELDQQVDVAAQDAGAARPDPVDLELGPRPRQPASEEKG